MSADEDRIVEALLSHARFDEDARARIAECSRNLVTAMREDRRALDPEVLLREFGLSTDEGVQLMVLAEALIRVPDRSTADRLVRDKLASGTTRSSPISGGSRAIALALDAARRLLRSGPDDTARKRGWLASSYDAASGRVVGFALRRAIGVLAGRFVMGSTLGLALARARRARYSDDRFSFDMLGEAAITWDIASRYREAYRNAIRALADEPSPAHSDGSRFGISVKLSALHPRYEYAQRARCVPELADAVLELVRLAQAAGIQLTLDAEESERLEVSLDVFSRVFHDPSLSADAGFGIAVQAYQTRALPVVEWLVGLAQRTGRRIPVRLVKGAYWDMEIKRAQVQGLARYPVFTTKSATDVSYLACARRLLEHRDRIYPQFATHNAATVAAVIAMAGRDGGYEFQRLHGMGESLYRALRRLNPDVRCRIYAPVGPHEELLPYLVRRLLENGAGASFVHLAADSAVPIDELIEDPVAAWTERERPASPMIPLPGSLFPDGRRNSTGIHLSDPVCVDALLSSMQIPLGIEYLAAPSVGTSGSAVSPRPVTSPADRGRTVGRVIETDDESLDAAICQARSAAVGWETTSAEDRAAILEQASDLIESERGTLVALLAREAGKTLPDALSEVREAVDYCRYYASCARRDFGVPLVMPGPTGERNEWRLRGRGVFAAISPWNFPLAIFVGQITAALAAGNAVVAKPARQTPLIAGVAVRLMHAAGVPEPALSLLPGSGETVGARLVRDPRVDGVVFTGSTATARSIQRALAERSGPIAVLIAETGGQNAMIVDSSALPEQVAADAVQSAFNSAGQRCSALRVLFLQDELADRVIELLRGAMDTLVLGDPVDPATDIGPLIDEGARAAVERHVASLAEFGHEIARVPVPRELESGSFFGPCAFEIDSIARLESEVFGPVLHVVRFGANALDAVVDAINSTGYGLTLGIHSRIDATVERIRRHARVGNLYVNRNMIGAVVGVQPFGGQGLSGTGPKAGGPLYLHRFAVEQSVSTNTAATGGNAALLAGRQGSMR